jgi:LysM repeat protein
MTIDKRLIDAAKQAEHSTGLPARFFLAWFISENGREWPATNNVGNISYTGEGVPHTGVFEGVTRVLDNRVCVYDTPQDGVTAFLRLLETPKMHKALSLDLEDLHACGGDVRKMCEVVGRSNWAESHYDDGHGPGSLIWDVYNSPDVAAAFASDHGDAKKAEPAPAKPERKPARTVYTVREGDTLTAIALRYRTTVAALAALNDIKDPNHITVGQRLELPYHYQVKPGDTVSALSKRFGSTVDEIAKANHINPDRIYTGQWLWV